MQIALGKDAELPKQRTEIQMETAQLHEYIGTYELSPVFSIVITRFSVKTVK